MHQCPTRQDGAEVLISQTVTKPMCQDRQRRYYHKCWSCVHRNGTVAARPAPVLELTQPVERRDAAAV